MTTSIADDYLDIKRRMREVMDQKIIELCDIPQVIRDIAVEILPTGSRYICNPPPIDTDSDWVILLSPGTSLSAAELVIMLTGFTLGGSDVADPSGIPSSLFRTFRKGELNLIVTEDNTYFRRFVKATQLAKQFNLLKKEDRIELFTAILYPVEVIC